MRRQLLWVLAALIAVPLLLLATAPELWGAAPRDAVGLYGLVLVAGVPGLVLLVVAALRRRRQSRDDR